MNRLHPDIDAPMARIRIVLVEPGHGGNIGACARAMRVMGLRELTLVRPRVPQPAVDAEAIAFASGALDVLEAAHLHGTLDEALGDVTLAVAVSAGGREFAADPVPPEEAARIAWDELARDPAHRVAFVFGTERTGLTVEQARRCQRLTSIPGAPGYHSLNLAQAVQIVAWELRRTWVAAAGTPAKASGAEALVGPDEPVDAGTAAAERFADVARVEALFAHLERALVAIGFLDPAHPKKLMPRLRRLLHRTRLEVEEVDLLRGMCTEMERVGREGPRKPRDGAG